MWRMQTGNRVLTPTTGRWLILAAVLALAWLLWPARPNLDARLFGDWQRGPLAYRYNPDGTFERGGPFPMSGYWSVEGTEIVLARRIGVVDRIRSWFSRQPSVRLNPPRYELVDVSTDTLTLRPIRPRPMSEEVYVRP